MNLSTLLSLLVVASCAACDSPQSDTAQPLGLDVSFAKKCAEQGGLAMRVGIANRSKENIAIPTGVLPWHFDDDSVSYEISIDGRKLPRREFYSGMQSGGPIKLAPMQQMSGDLPLYFMFPQLNETKGRAIMHWRYQVEGNGVLKGEVQLDNNCEPNTDPAFAK